MAVSKLTERRLTKLIRFMRSLPKSAEEHFYMGSWFSHNGGPHHEQLRHGHDIKPQALNLCGTTACALGWAATIPGFRRAGLKLVFDREWSIVRYRNRTTRAGERFFQITEEQAEELFSGICSAQDGSRITTPKQWAAMAAAAVRRWKKEAREG